MALPLPNEIRNITENFPNLSLKYYKRIDIYEDGNFKELKKDKKSFLNDFVNLSKKTEYNDVFSSIREKYLQKIGIQFSLHTASRLLFGIGYEHPTKIGFMFDWTSGLPIIPGSSLKGVALHIVENYIEEIKDLSLDNSEKDEIFGTKNNAGRIIFLPAYPIIEKNKAFLELDVMTPHYQPYYSNSEENPPADWYSPIPLHFLTVPEGIKYCFRLADREKINDTNLKKPDGELTLLGKAEKILKYALTEFGVGAKTSIFYGYFK
ncbi:MAG: type III-B CRISPR module RAMP protein Cmr6 [Candidatus Firestonebacteria bacterium]|nr:type III-B CRISPR module RAMP protein Cmr6 [Candidatus Firestonebacteria bacterium]